MDALKRTVRSIRPELEAAGAGLAGEVAKALMGMLAS